MAALSAGGRASITAALPPRCGSNGCTLGRARRASSNCSGEFSRQPRSAAEEQQTSRRGRRLADAGHIAVGIDDHTHGGPGLTQVLHQNQLFRREPISPDEDQVRDIGYPAHKVRAGHVWVGELASLEALPVEPLINEPTHGRLPGANVNRGTGR
jgi:hypothetical protein